MLYPVAVPTLMRHPSESTLGVALLDLTSGAGTWLSIVPFSIVAEPLQHLLVAASL